MRLGQREEGWATAAGAQPGPQLMPWAVKSPAGWWLRVGAREGGGRDGEEVSLGEGPPEAHSEQERVTKVGTPIFYPPGTHTKGREAEVTARTLEPITLDARNFHLYASVSSSVNRMIGLL